MPADPKPPARKRDRYVFLLFHDQNYSCVCCGRRPVEAHHLLSRAQGGDDTLSNLVPLCVRCHGAIHGHTYRSEGRRIDNAHVKKTIGLYLGSKQGTDALAYLRQKRTDGWLLANYGLDLA